MPPTSFNRSPQSAAKRLSPTPQTPLSSLPSTAQRQLLSLFDRYQRERLLFAQSLAELAAREGTADALAAAGATRLLRPLMTDAVPAVQQAAAMAVGRMASWSEEVAGEVVREGIVEGLVGGLVNGNRFHKKACAFVLRSISKHSPAHARFVADGGALPALARCIEDFDPQVKEGAVWAVGYVARQDSDLAQRVVSASLLPLLVLCLQEPSGPLRRVAASALSDVAKHTPPLAHAVLDALAVRHLVPLTTHADAKLRRQAFSALGQIAKHGIDMAESVVDGQGAGDDGAVVVEAVVRGVRDEDAAVRRAAATLVCEVVKHSEELSQLFVNSGALAPLVDYVTSTTGVSRLPGIMALGYISAFGEALALAVAVTGGVDAVARAMDTDEEDLVKSACAWTLGQVGRHSPEHARAVAASGALLRLADIVARHAHVPASNQSGSPIDARPATPPIADLSSDTLIAPMHASDLPTKAHRALKFVLAKTTGLVHLDPLLTTTAPRSVLKHVIVQLAKVLPNDVAARKDFVSRGGLGRLEVVKRRLEEEDGEKWKGGKTAEAVRIVEDCYPEEIVRYYSPDYSKTLLDRIEEYGRAQASPASQPVALPNTGMDGQQPGAGSFVADLPHQSQAPSSASHKSAPMSKRASQAVLNAPGAEDGKKVPERAASRVSVARIQEAEAGGDGEQ